MLLENFRPRPLDRGKMPLLYKLHQSNVSRCLLEKKHYLVSLSDYRLLFTAFVEKIMEHLQIFGELKPPQPPVSNGPE